MNGRSFEKIYRNAPREVVEELLEFRADHPPVRAEIAGTEWTYRCAGKGPESLLILPGATGDGEQPFRNITALARRYRVISPDYPPVGTMRELAGGLAGLLDREGVDKCHVLGGSYGGMVAQVFMRLHPGRVLKVVLSHTAAPREESFKKVRTATRLLPLFPMWLLRALSKLEIKKQLKPFPEAASFYVPYFKERLVNLKRPDIKAMTERVTDLYANYKFKPEDFVGWQGRILIVDANEDRMVPTESQEFLRELYPAARIHTFEGTGHVSTIVKREEFLEVVNGFLAES
jgi:pimeloyl-ACP methyl ester carboxylesterase